MATTNDKMTFNYTRRFDVSKLQVWHAWSNADALKLWWGPKGCALEIARLEFRPGGFFHYAMVSDTAPAMWGRFNYREIQEPDRLVWLNSFSNEHCGIARAPFSQVCPLEIENTVTFSEEGDTTTVSLRAEPFGEVEEESKFFVELCTSGSLEQGTAGTFDKLADHLAATRKIDSDS